MKVFFLLFVCIFPYRALVIAIAFAAELRLFELLSFYC